MRKRRTLKNAPMMMSGKMMPGSAMNMMTSARAKPKGRKSRGKA